MMRLDWKQAAWKWVERCGRYSYDARGRRWCVLHGPYSPLAHCENSVENLIVDLVQVELRQNRSGGLANTNRRIGAGGDFHMRENGQATGSNDARRERE
jgi:hypothetical protein